MKTNLNRHQSRAAIDAREDFTNSTKSLRGVKNPSTIGKGRLNEDETNRLLDDQTKPGITYLVYSYDTPIAWEKSDGSRYRVSQKFSSTTSQHMGLTFTSSPAKVEA